MLGVPFFAAVVVDFGVRSAGAFPDFPEVGFARDHVLFRNTAFHPEVMGGLVIGIIGHIKFMGIKSVILFAGQKLIGPGNDFRTEVIADGEISPPLKEGMMTGSMSDIVDVVGPDAFLGIGDPPVLWGQGAVKVFLQGGNACIDPEQSRIVLRNQGRGRLDVMAVVLEEV